MIELLLLSFFLSVHHFFVTDVIAHCGVFKQETRQGNRSKKLSKTRSFFFIYQTTVYSISLPAGRFWLSKIVAGSYMSFLSLFAFHFHSQNQVPKCRHVNSVVRWPNPFFLLVRFSCSFYKYSCSSCLFLFSIK